jgi:iron complex transport system substrate-binding protein
MIFALGLQDRLKGVTHECDYPREAADKPIVVRNVLPLETMSLAEIDVAVAERIRNGQSLYQVDEAQLRAIAPDLIVTQDLCQVCAPSGNEVSRVLKALPHAPQILWLTPKSIEQIFDNLRDLGAATGRQADAEALIKSARERLGRVRASASRGSARPKVFCMEWIDPVYCSGHWVPEMVEIAGGVDALGRKGTDSVRIGWDDVLRWAPDILVVMPCGFDLPKAAEQARALSRYPGFFDLPAAKQNRVYAVNASAYFARPGPRVVDGTELLAHLLHPELFDWGGPRDAFERIDVAALAHAAAPA